MKRTFVLLTLVAALVAAPAFAETTFSGSVQFEYGTNFDEYASGYDEDSAISLDGTVGEFTTVSVGIEADDDSIMTMNNATLEQDVTGALGMDTPVSFAYKMGVQDFSPVDYGTVNGYNSFGADAGTSTALSTVATFGIMDMVTVDTYVNLQSLVDEAAEFGVNAYGTVDMVSYSLYYVTSQYDDTLNDDGDGATDATGDYVGANFKIDLSPLTVGVIVEADLTPTFEGYDFIEDEIFFKTFDDEVIVSYGISAGYDITEALNAGVAFQSKYCSLDTGAEFGDISCFGINATYKVMDNFSVWGAFKANTLNDDFSDNMGYELGAEASLDGVTYCIGWSDSSDYKAYDHGIEDGALFVKISTSF